MTVEVPLPIKLDQLARQKWSVRREIGRNRLIGRPTLGLLYVGGILAAANTENPWIKILSAGILVSAVLGHRVYRNRDESLVRRLDFVQGCIEFTEHS